MQQAYQKLTKRTKFEFAMVASSWPPMADDVGVTAVPQLSPGFTAGVPLKAATERARCTHSQRDTLQSAQVNIAGHALSRG
jgi:hypothetical protein